MLILTAGVHQDLISFGRGIAIVFRTLVGHSVVANLSTNNRALLIYHKHRSANRRRLLTKLIPLDLFFCVCFLIEVGQACLVRLGDMIDKVV